MDGAPNVIAMKEAKTKGSQPMPIDQETLAFWERMYSLSWYGILIGGRSQQLEPARPLVFRHSNGVRRWCATSISDWRTSGLEVRELEARAALDAAKADMTKANAQIAEAQSRTKEAEADLARPRALTVARHIDERLLAEMYGGQAAEVIRWCGSCTCRHRCLTGSRLRP